MGMHECLKNDLNAAVGGWKYFDIKITAESVARSIFMENQCHNWDAESMGSFNKTIEEQIKAEINDKQQAEQDIFLSPFGWKNKGRTSERSEKCKNCGPWKEHFKKVSDKEWPSECSVSECNEEPTDGAHMIQNNNGIEYIVPSCRRHNKAEGELTLKDRFNVVHANVEETCSKGIKEFWIISKDIAKPA